MNNFDYKNLEFYMKALNSQLKIINKRIELVVCGGSALAAIGLVNRTTNDVDVLGIVERSDSKLIINRASFPNWFKSAIEKVARDFNLPPNWINAGPTSLVDFGLPRGLEERLIGKRFGDYLTVHYISRIDQIFLKLYASVDRGGYHIDDLMKLKPSSEKIEAAARWGMTHDVSEAYRELLKSLLRRLGFNEVAKRI